MARFTIDDQRRFASLSGDWNPIHVDPVAARRTAAGTLVVHGVHLLLQSLDRAARAGHATRPLVSIRASFGRFVSLDEEVAFRIPPPAEGSDKVRIQIAGPDGVRSEILLRFDGGERPITPPVVAGPRFDPDEAPHDPAPQAMDGLSGTLSFAQPPALWAKAFPQAAAWLGAERLAALGTSTRLVGMVCPGLHSVFLELRAVLQDQAPACEDQLGFTMGTARHGLIEGSIEGGGMLGAVRCLIRARPVTQSTTAALQAHVAPDRFAGDSVLVVGGSRGLGEVAAKLLAAGGAHVSITYAQGKADAARIAAEISRHGGACDIASYHVGTPASAQLADLRVAPTHIYYFATPAIARANSHFYDHARLAEMLAFYVDGFWDLATAVRALRADARIFYPSTTYVEGRPRGLAEYAMAKAAGEALCGEINATMAPLRIHVARLPQLATDQNLTSLGVAGSDPADALLPHLLAMHAPD